MYTDLQKMTSNIAHLHRILCIVNLYHRALTMSSMYFFQLSIVFTSGLYVHGFVKMLLTIFNHLLFEAFNDNFH